MKENGEDLNKSEINLSNKGVVNMAKLSKKKKNLISLIIGIILILIGMSGTSISLARIGFEFIVIVPLVLLIVGFILTYMGSERKW